MQWRACCRARQSALCDGRANTLLDQIPCGGDFARQINTVRIDRIHDACDSQTEETRACLKGVQCPSVTASGARNQVQDRKGLPFDLLQTFWTKFGHIPSEIALQGSE